jgi:anthranilate phosphoribosyltransferase
MSLLPYLHRVAAGGDLSSEEAHAAMGVLLAGGAGEAEIAGFLVALKMKGETATEIAGFARAMRDCMIVVDTGRFNVIDTCGTGGDGSGTFNISTAAALVMAGAGAHVAKHGNRSISSTSGSADVLEALGVRAVMTPEEAARSIREIGIGFLFAPAMHPAMKHAQPVRRALKTRTVFNLLGPLVNPAGAKRQVMGVSDARWILPIAQVLQALGTEHAIVAHSRDGMDEFSTCAPTDYAEVKDGQIVEKVLFPHEYDYHCVDETLLAGGDAAQNATVIWDILTHGTGAPADIACLNAGAALVVSGIAADFSDGMKLARESLKSGAAHKKLKQLVDFVEEIKS